MKITILVYVEILKVVFTSSVILLKLVHKCYKTDQRSMKDSNTELKIL